MNEPIGFIHQPGSAVTVELPDWGGAFVDWPKTYLTND